MEDLAELGTTERRELRTAVRRWTGARRRELLLREEFQQMVADLIEGGATAGAIVRAMGEDAPISRVRVWQIGREHANGSG